ncbi:lantibiotic dehydratase [Metaclostridioides mangenotii]|uniref:Thiopeptide-type bacteriocin biosynthesis protein n=1 Tax=Metaclostridioides mangenotii TaxID=1540 RepID=A0ABS4E7Z2_9FIRM|nr:lantibiotic dehydratase [Clostridioides mangenotii]MBP1854046.1 thiopeptide-type bacteriocin biosynthesis protein [Clostridioides mangenotii]
MKDKGIYNQVKNMLMVSSENMFNMLLNIENGKVKYNDTFESSLIKYLIRASTRATPFGLCAGVGIGSFGKKTSLCMNDTESLVEVKVDNKWICNVTYQLENNKDILDKLSLKFNNNTYMSGNRLKNSQISLHGADSKNRFSEYSIKNTHLINIIREYTRNYRSYKEVINYIKEEYPGVDNLLVENTVKDLIDNEFLITNLKQAPYCKDTLNHIIFTLNSLGLNEYSKKYEDINRLIYEIKKTLSANNISTTIELDSVYCELINKMSSIFKADNYIYINKGIRLSNSNLDVSIRNDLNNFINKFSNILYNENSYQEEFCEKVTEKYGYNTLIPLTDIIDTNKLNILNTIENINSDNIDEREKKIKNIIEFKILQSISMSKDEVKLTEDDFKEAVDKDKFQTIETVESFDLNVIIKKLNSDNYEYFITNNPGSDRATSIYNRFYDVLKYEDKYINILNKLKNKDTDYQSENNCFYAEIRELLSDSRTINVRNDIKINNKCLSFSLGGDDNDSELFMEDLYVIINEDNKVNVVHAISGKKIIFIKNDMLNENGHSKLANLLYSITNSKYNTLNRLYFLFNNKYIFTPRIKFENVVIKPKQWKIYKEMFSDIKDYDLFLEEFCSIKNIFKIDKYVYLTESDNRLLIDLENKIFYEYLFKQIKRSSHIILEEFEFNSNKELLLEDKVKNRYMSEYSLSFFKKEEVKNTDKFNNTYKESIVTDSKFFILPFEKNWLYYKLYGVDGRENEVIYNIEELFKLIEKSSIKFFIRYIDEGGKNLRIRLKFDNNEDLMNVLMLINDYIYKLKNEGMIYTATIETYLPEISRYGGINLMNEIERFFTADSEFVMELLKKVDLYDSSDVEFYYFLGIISILKVFYTSDDEIVVALEKYTDNSKWRNEFKTSRQRYLDFSEILFYNDPIKIEKINYLIPLLEKRNTILKEIKNKLISDNNITSIDSIIFSITHMFCNRFKGNPLEEEKMTHLIRHSIRELNNRKRHYK